MAACLPSLSLLPIWVNVSLTPWFSEFHAVWFSGTSGCLLFVNWLLSFLWLFEKVKYFYLCLHLGQNLLCAFLNKGNLQLQFKFPLAKFFPKIKFSEGYLEQESGIFLFPFVCGQSFLLACKIEAGLSPNHSGRKEPSRRSPPTIFLEMPSRNSE